MTQKKRRSRRTRRPIPGPSSRRRGLLHGSPLGPRRPAVSVVVVGGGGCSAGVGRRSRTEVESVELLDDLNKILLRFVDDGGGGGARGGPVDDGVPVVLIASESKMP